MGANGGENFERSDPGGSAWAGLLAKSLRSGAACYTTSSPQAIAAPESAGACAARTRVRQTSNGSQPEDGCERPANSSFAASCNGCGSTSRPSTSRDVCISEPFIILFSRLPEFLSSVRAGILVASALKDSDTFIVLQPIRELLRKIAGQILLESTAIARLDLLLFFERLLRLLAEFSQPLIVRRIQLEEISLMCRGHTQG
jgi:hypothetical protein